MTATITPRFEDVRADRPDLDALERQVDAIRAALAAERDVERCLALVEEWDGLRRAFGTWSALVHLAFQRDTRDPRAKAEREHADEIEPRWTRLEVDVMRALLDHPLRAELERRIGAQAFALWNVAALAFDPALEPDLVREAKLSARYTELCAAAEIPVFGETHNLSTIVRFRQDPDRAVRHAAERALWGWAEANAPELDRVFDELVALRTDSARKLGMDDFVELGYRRRSRIDYGRADVERLRAEVVQHVVPLASELARRQREELGLDELMAWDEPVRDPRGNPAPREELQGMLASAQRMFDALGGDLGPFFRRMSEGGFLDLASRPGKAAGGFCTSFPTHGMPFVFANFNGTKGDVEVFTHEMGHAFQAFASREKRPSDYLWPTLESCEIHSMSLEFLTWPHMELFFGDDAERFRRAHLAEALCFLPYGCLVDHFQHEVYARPKASPAERHATWLALERTYLPHRRWGDLAYPAKGGRWQLQRHVYLSPFYYIDYVLAQTCALQFWARAERDREEALQSYVALCRRGGEAPFRELVRSAGLRSPFEPGCLEAVVEDARRVLLA